MTGHPTFTHLEEGTPESVWEAAWQRHSEGVPGQTWVVVSADSLLEGVTHLVVVAAHPDDESLGAAGLLLAGRRGIRVTALILTAGEASHPRSPTHHPADLAQRRTAEASAAVAELAPHAVTTMLGLPDGTLHDEQAAVTTHLVDLIGLDGTTTLVVAPWRRDGHPDHEAAGRAAAAAAQRTDSALLEYPVWLWHWGSAHDVPWAETLRVRLDGAARARKRRAVMAHASQVAPLSEAEGDEAVIGPAMLTRASRDYEVYFRCPPGDDALDQLHRDSDDPWQVDHSWYEARKRAVTLACLPHQRYGRVLEVGCSVGRLAEDLADRADRLLAMDASPAAVSAATQRLEGRPHVEVIQASLPADWPDVTADLIVVSEVGYFLSPGQLASLLQCIDTSLAPDGHLVLCHWRHDVVGWPLDGDAVHSAALRQPGWTSLVSHTEPDFRVDVLELSRRSS